MEDDNNRTRNFLEPGEWAPADCREEIRAIELEYQQRLIREAIDNPEYQNRTIQDIIRNSSLPVSEVFEKAEESSERDISQSGLYNQIQEGNRFYYENISQEILERSLRGIFSTVREDYGLHVSDIPIPFVDTPKRKLARKRNWNKFRILGFTLSREGLTEEEYYFYKQFKEMMLTSWDDESRRLGLTPGKKKDRFNEENITDSELPF